MAWMISNQEKKNVTETETWTKDGETLTHETGWRWGKWRTETAPDLSKYDEDEGCDPCDLFDAEMDSTDDGCWEEWTWPDEVDEEEAERLEDIYNEDAEEGLENEDWVLDDTEYWVSGPLDIEQEISWYVNGEQPLVVVESWHKDDLIVEQRLTYAKTHVVFDNEPDFIGHDPEDQIEILSMNIPAGKYKDAELVSEVWEFPEDMSTKEKNWFKKYNWDKWAKAGWSMANRQVWVTGALNLTVDDRE